MADEWDHDPELEPYASMTKAEIIELMKATEDGYERRRLNEFLMDQMTTSELIEHNHTMSISRLLIAEYGAKGNDQCFYLCELAMRVAAEVATNMPAVGPPHEVN